MKGLFKVRLALAAAAAGALAFAALPASASIGAAEITGSGTISPGLVLTGSSQQTFTWSGSGVAATDTFQGAFSCNWSGNDTIGNITQGSGSFTGTCTFGATTESVSGSYTRTGTVITISATMSGGPVVGSFGAGCKVWYTSFPPTTIGFHCWLWW
jgi:hypothetical protein